MSAELLRQAVTKLRETAATARTEVLASRYFGHDLNNFGSGIQNACGDAAGDLAALMTPDLAETLAEWLELFAAMYDQRLVTEVGSMHALAVANAILGDSTDDASSRSRGVASNASPAAGPVHARTGLAAPGVAW